jgi:hypothetical protein
VHSRRGPPAFRSLARACFLVSLLGAPGGARSAADANAPARAFFERWLAAQNGGDFAAYKELYSPRFHGIRRSGKRLAKLDYAGWMSDRERMFKKKMTVAAEGLTISGGDGLTVLRFTQRWESGSYHDAGPKRIVVVSDDGKPRILSEVLESSTIEQRPAAAAGQSQPFLWIVEGEGVQLTDKPEWSWGHGGGGVDKKSGDVRRDVSAKDLPGEQARWLGRTLRLFSFGGEKCQAKVTGFRLVGRAQIDDDTRAELKRQRKNAAAEQLWELAGEHGHSLVATVDNLCAARWARDAADAAPEIAPAEKADPTLVKRALVKLKALDECKEDGLCTPKTVTVVTFRPRWQGKQVTLVWAMVEGESLCESNGFGYAWWLEGKALKPAQGVSQEVLPSAAVDIDGDGRPELLFDKGGSLDPDLEAGVLSLSPDTDDWKLLDELYFPYIGCPC